MVKKYYLISLADNDLWYTEDHGGGDRWSPNLADAYRFSSRELAEIEIGNDLFDGAVRFFITELLVKE